MTDSLATMTVGKKPAAKTKKPRSKPTHPRTADMVNAAIKSLKDRSGSSLQAIKKYINATYKVDAEKQAPFIKKYIKAAVENGGLVQTKGKGAAGSFKLSVHGEVAKRGAKSPGRIASRAKAPAKTTKKISRTPVKKPVKSSRVVKKIEAVKKVAKPLAAAEKKKTVKGPAAKPPKVKVKSAAKTVKTVKKSPVKAKAAKKSKKVPKKK